MSIHSMRSFLSTSRRQLRRLTGRYIPPPIEVEKAEQVFYIQYLQPGMVVFDVGANIGELSLLFSRFVGPQGQVHAFEASRDTFARLERVIETANRKNLYLNHVALSDRTGTAQLRVYDTEHAGWTTLADRPLENYGIHVRPERIEDVPMTTIDAYCEAHGIERIDLVKIDVEGAEQQVIAGAERMMAEDRIGCLVFEFGQTTFDMGNNPHDLAQMIKTRGYRLRNLNPGAPLFPGGHSVATAQFSMHIATPRT